MAEVWEAWIQLISEDPPPHSLVAEQYTKHVKSGTTLPDSGSISAAHWLFNFKQVT